MNKLAMTAINSVRRFCRVVLWGMLCLPSANAQETVPAVDMVVEMASELFGTHPDGLGGVSVDRLGYTYVADFGEVVWKISPHGYVEELARGFYGAAGNAISSQGSLLQVNHYAGTVVRVGRWGEIETVVRGLNRPLGITLGSRGRLYLTECGSNSIRTALMNGNPQPFAKSKLFDCPSGLVWARGRLYVVSRNNGIVAEVDTKGEVTEFARIPGNGSAGIAYGRGRLFVTNSKRNQIYRVSMDGKVDLLSGSGERGLVDGPRLEAKLSRPSGIASVDGKILFNERIDVLGPLGAPQGLIALRKLRLQSIFDVLLIASASGKVEDLVAAYREYLADPAHRGEPNEKEVDALAERLSRSGTAEMSSALLQLNAESHPNSWQAQNRLAASLASGGKVSEALRAYRRSLKLNPANESASQAISELRRKK